MFKNLSAALLGLLLLGGNKFMRMISRFIRGLENLVKSKHLKSHENCEKLKQSWNFGLKRLATSRSSLHSFSMDGFHYEIRPSVMNLLKFPYEVIVDTSVTATSPSYHENTLAGDSGVGTCVHRPSRCP